MRKVAIIHFQPLELYPPVQNILSFLKNEEMTVEVFSLLPPGDISKFDANGENIRLYQYPTVYRHNVARRWFGYIRFYFGVLKRLFKRKPDAVLYFETYSSFPAWLYFLLSFKTKKPDILVHYHEYAAKEEIRKGSFLFRILHWLEKRMYRHAKWLSHTNEQRLSFFLNDCKLQRTPNTKVLPNWPPKLWIKKSESTVSFPVKIVYVGAVSLETMFIKEFAYWIEKQKGSICWDIYTQQNDNELRTFLQQINARYISVKGFIPYSMLPDVLYQYHAGVILYKGHIPNYVFNAPNKLFEYLACGLDVFYPAVMKEITRYNESRCYPGVMPVDFNKPEGIIEFLIGRTKRVYRPCNYFYEQKLPELAAALSGK